MTIRQKILRVITQDEPNVRKSFLTRYKDQINKYIEEVSRAFHNWESLDSLTHENEEKKHVSALVFSAINMSCLSMRLFLSGYIVAAGNLQRQFIETISLAILCSYKPLGFLKRYRQNDYLSMNAPGDLLKNAEIANIKKEYVEYLRKARKYYHPYSHPSFVTVSTSMSDQGWVLGPYYDDRKTDYYDTEIAGHIFISEVIGGLVDIVKENISRW